MRQALTIAAVTALALPAFADEGPDAPVREAYAVTEKTLAGEGGAEPPWRPPHRDRLMSQSLAAMFARDDLYQDESEDMGHVDADPFLSGQDGEIKSLRLSVSQKPAGGKAGVTAQFRSFGQPVTVRFRMVEEGGRWRIDDIVNRVDGKDFSMREQLSRPYPCGSFMKKPCKK